MFAWLPLLGNSFCLLVSGAIIGWLVGLSASPTVQVVITSILAIIGGLLGALAEIKRPETGGEASPLGEGVGSGALVPVPVSPKLSPVPIALLLIGVFLGSLLGLRARTHDWFGAEPQPLINKWKSTGLKDEEIARRLFDQLYPPVSPAERKYEEKILVQDPKALVKRWTDKDFGLNKEVVARRLFDQIYPPVAPFSEEKKPDKPGKSLEPKRR